MAIRTTVRLPPELLRRAKRKAAAEGQTLTSLIEDGLRRVLNEQSEASQPVALPISTAAGGLMPGIDLNRHSTLQEIDDLEMVARWKSR
jgi:hypothetical protein